MLTKIDVAILAWVGLLGLLFASGTLLAQLQGPRPALAMQATAAGGNGARSDVNVNRSRRATGQHLWTQLRTALITVQRTCPVADRRLPENSTWTVVGGRVVFVCCAPCGEKVQADPEVYFRKLDEKNLRQRKEVLAQSNLNVHG